MQKVKIVAVFSTFYVVVALVGRQVSLGNFINRHFVYLDFAHLLICSIRAGWREAVVTGTVVTDSSSLYEVGNVFPINLSLSDKQHVGDARTILIPDVANQRVGLSNFCFVG